MEAIDDRRSKAKGNGICEQLPVTVLNEFYEVAFRKKIYAHSRSYNPIWMGCLDFTTTNDHTGADAPMENPMQTFLDSIPFAKEKMIAA